MGRTWNLRERLSLGRRRASPSLINEGRLGGREVIRECAEREELALRELLGSPLWSPGMVSSMSEVIRASLSFFQVRLMGPV